MTSQFKCGLVLLAAGGSRRMGRPKQLLSIAGKPMVRYTAERVLDQSIQTFVVVVGCEADKIEEALDGLPLTVAVNPCWRDGLSSSLRIGIERALSAMPDLDAVIVVLGDQPSITWAHLAALTRRFQEGGASAVASLVEGESVPPVVFGRAWFERLKTLTGDVGARALMREQSSDVVAVPFANPSDLDTNEDYVRFRAESGEA